MASSSSALHSSITSCISPFPAAMEGEELADTETCLSIQQTRYFGRSSITLCFDKRSEEISIYANIFLNKKDRSSIKLKKFLTKDYLIVFLKLNPSLFSLHIDNRNGARSIEKIFNTLIQQAPLALRSFHLLTNQPSQLPAAFPDLLQACPTLIDLTIGSMFDVASAWTLTDASLKQMTRALSTLTSLQKLSFENVKMSEKMFVSIFETLAASGSQLTTLKLKSLTLHQKACQGISSVMFAHPNLSTVTVTQTPLDREQIVSLFCGLFVAPSLSTLDLRGDQTRLDKVIGKALSLLLSNTSSLTSLELPHIETEAMIALKDGLKENSTLDSLRLTFTKTEDPDSLEQRTRAIAEVIADNTTLTDLALAEFSAHHHWSMIAEALIANPTTLGALTIAQSEDRMGDEPAIELARALSHNRSLYLLNLQGVSCEEEGFCSLARSLHQHITLSQLVFPPLIHTQRTINALSTLLEHNQEIKKLTVQSKKTNQREPLSLTPLAEALNRNSTLKDLILSIPSSEKDTIDFIQSIQANTSLTNVQGFSYLRNYQAGPFETFGFPDAIHDSLGTMLSNNRLRELTLFGILYSHLSQSTFE